MGVVAVALVPVLRMFRLVRGVTPMPYGDYWLIFPGLVRDDGSVELGNLLARYNDHPLFGAKVLYAITLRAFDGSNTALAYMVLLVGLGQVVVIGLLLARSALSAWEKGALLVLASALLFSLNGGWNFVYAMSGAAWLTANLFVLIALLLRQRDRYWEALAVGVVATASYQTGLAVWPALVVVGLVRRPWREWWRELLPLAGFVVADRLRAAQSDLPADIPFAPAQIVRDTARLIGFAIGLDAPTDATVGRIALLAAGLLIGWAVLRRVESAAAWAGLATYGLLSCAFIAYGRPDFLGAEPGHRYQSLPALLWIGLAVLAVHWYRGGVVRLTADRNVVVQRAARAGAVALVAVPLIVGTSGTGEQHRRELEESRTVQDLGAIALRLGVDDDLEIVMRFGRSPTPVETLRAAGQYPFSPSWDADCGRLGDRLEPGSGPEDGGVARANRSPALDGGIKLAGSIPADIDLDCILVVDISGEVVGAGVLDRWPNSFRTADDQPYVFRAVALDGRGHYDIVVVSDSGDEIALADGISLRDVTDP